MIQVNPAAVMERLGIDRESFRALGILPLIHIAWADGKIQMGERNFIRSFARQKGWLTGRVEVLLDTWLNNRPEDDDAADGAAAFAALARERRGLGASIPEGAVDSIMLACRDVAAASGGMFGFKSPICDEEDVALQRLCEALGLARGRNWREVCEDLDAAPDKESAPGSSGHFLLGKAPEMLNDPLSLMVDSWRRFGDVVKIDLGPTFFHLVVHPDDVKHVLVDNARNYVRDEMVDALKRVFGEALLTSEGEAWRFRRRTLQPGFHTQKLNGMVATMVELTRDFLASLSAAADSGQPIDIVENTSELALRIAGHALFHTETGGDAAAFQWTLPIILAQIAERHRSLVKLPEFIPTAGNRRFREALTAIDNVIFRTIAARREMKEDPDDLLSLMMAARDEATGKPLSDKDLRDELSLMIVAAHETSATGLAWTFYQLSKFPVVTREAREEARRVLDGRALAVTDLPQLGIITQVIEESLRLRPPAWLITRKAVAEDNLSGHHIPAGSNVLITPYLTHRHPKFWPNPEGFDPTRFAPEASRDRHPFAFLPFGGGPRKCIGMGFAMMEMQIAIAMVLSAYDLHLVPGFEPQINPTTSLRPLDGCWMTVHRL